MESVHETHVLEIQSHLQDCDNQYQVSSLSYEEGVVVDEIEQQMDELMEEHFREMSDEIQRSLDEDIQEAMQKQFDEYLEVERNKAYSKYQEEIERELNEASHDDEDFYQHIHLANKPPTCVAHKPTFADINAQIRDIVRNYQQSSNKETPEL